MRCTPMHDSNWLPADQNHESNSALEIKDKAENRNLRTLRKRSSITAELFHECTVRSRGLNIGAIYSQNYPHPNIE